MSDQAITDIHWQTASVPESEPQPLAETPRMPFSGALREWSPTEMAFLNVYFQTLPEKEMSPDDRRLRIEWMRQHQLMVKAGYGGPQSFSPDAVAAPRRDASDSDFALWIRSNLRGIF